MRNGARTRPQRVGDYLLGVAPAGEHENPRFAKHLAERRFYALKGLIGGVLGLAAGLGSGVFYLFQSDAVGQFVFSFGLVLMGAGLGFYARARKATVQDREQLSALGSIFLTEPRTLKTLFEGDAIDKYVRNLLRTVIDNDELGDDVYTQAVVPLVDSMSEGKYRERQRYEIKFQTIDDPLLVEAPGGRLAFSGDDYERQWSLLEFGRRFTEKPSFLWLGIVFDASIGRHWYTPGERYFCLREYTPIAKNQVAQLCAACAVDFEPGLPTACLDREPASPAALPLIQQFCTPGLTVGGTELVPDDVGIGAAGMAIRFPVPEDLRDTLGKGDRARVSARLSLPVAKTVGSFPVFVVEPTRGVEIVFDYGQSSIATVREEIFLTGEKPFRSDHIRDDQGDKRIQVTTADEQWVFAGNGVVFLWEDDPAAPSIVQPPLSRAHPVDDLLGRVPKDNGSEQSVEPTPGGQI